MLRAYARDREMRINLGIRRRLAPLLGNDRRKIELLNALLFSLPGTPVIYYGDEIGMGDNVYLGDRDGVRTPMQWSADRNAGFSRANPHRLYLPLIAEQGYHYEAVNVEAPDDNTRLAAVVDAPADRAPQAPPGARSRRSALHRAGQPARARVRPHDRRRAPLPLRRQPVAPRPARRARPACVRRRHTGRGVRPVAVRARRRPPVPRHPRAVRLLLVRAGAADPDRRAPGPARAARALARGAPPAGALARAIGRWLPLAGGTRARSSRCAT
jgi:hypothetical protein